MPKRRDEQAPYWQQLRKAERGIIEFALEHGQTIRGTAALLGISPNYLSERLRELGIAAPEVRPGPKPGTKRPARPQLRVVSDAPVAAVTEPAETLDEDAPDAPEEVTDEGEKWYEDAEEDEDGDGDGDEDELNDDFDQDDAEDDQDGEDASSHGN